MSFDIADQEHENCKDAKEVRLKLNEHNVDPDEFVFHFGAFSVPEKDDAILVSLACATFEYVFHFNNFVISQRKIVD
jgi:hypothetical protein